MLNLTEVMNYLGIGRSHVEGLIRKKKLRAYRVGGTYLRFRKQDVESLIPYMRRIHKPDSMGALGRIADLWRYYSFYILLAVLVTLTLFVFVLK